MNVATSTGVIELAGMSKEDRSTVGTHWNAIHRHLNPDKLHQYNGKDVDDLRNAWVTGYRVDSDVPESFELESNLSLIERLASEGKLQPEEIYKNRKAA